MPDVVIVDPAVQLAELKPGERLVLTFRPDAPDKLLAVIKLASAGQLSLPLRSQEIIREVRRTGVWASDAQRTFRVAPTNRFDAARFIELVWDGIEAAAISPKGSRYRRRSTPVLPAKRVKPNRRLPD